MTEPEDKEREAIRRLPCELCGMTHGPGWLHNVPLAQLDAELARLALEAAAKAETAARYLGTTKQYRNT